MAKKTSDIELTIGANLENLQSDLEKELKRLKTDKKNAVKLAVFGEATGFEKLDKAIDKTERKLESLKSKIISVHKKIADSEVQSLSAAEKATIKRLEIKKRAIDLELQREKTKYTELNNAHKIHIESNVARHKNAFEKLKQLNKIALNEQNANLRLAEEAQKASSKRMLQDQIISAREASVMRSKAKKEEMNTFMGSITGGTSMGHKIGTTAQYALAGAGIYAVAKSFGELKDAIVESDKYMHMFMGVLEMSGEKAKGLQQDIFNVGKEIGGTVTGMSEAALMLGRAGIENEKLAEGLRVASMAANIAGDSIENITEMFAAWKTVYPEASITHLGDMMAKIANESLLSIDGLKTATSYIAATGAAAGVTADSLVELAGAWKQTGKADSIVGTEMRRFFMMIEGGSEEARKAYWTLGIDIEKVNAGLKKGGKDSEAAMSAMMKAIRNATPEQLQALDAVKAGMSVLEKQTINSSLVAAKEYERMEKAAEHASGSLKTASDKIALSYEKMWERIVFAGKEGATKFEEGFKEGFSSASVTAEEFNADMKKLSDGLNEFARNAGVVAGIVVDKLDDIAVAFALFKAGGMLQTGLAAVEVGLVSQVGVIDKLKKAWLAFNIVVRSNPIVMAVIAGWSLYELADSYRAGVQEEFDKKSKEWEGTQAKLGADRKKELESTSGKIKSITQLIEAQTRALNSQNLTETQRKAIQNGIIANEKRINDLKKGNGKPTVNVGTGGASYVAKDKTPKKVADDSNKRYKEKLEEIKLTEQEYFSTNKITAELDKQAYHLEHSVQKQIDATKILNNEVDRRKELNKQNRDREETEQKILDLTTKYSEQLTAQENALLKSKQQIYFMSDDMRLQVALADEKLAIEERLRLQKIEYGKEGIKNGLTARAEKDADNAKLVAGAKLVEQRRVNAVVSKKSLEDQLRATKELQTQQTASMLSDYGLSNSKIEMLNIEREARNSINKLIGDQSAILEQQYGSVVISKETELAVNESIKGQIDSINDKELQLMATKEIQAEYQRATEAGHELTKEQLDEILNKYKEIESQISGIDITAKFAIDKESIKSIDEMSEKISDLGRLYNKNNKFTKKYGDVIQKTSKAGLKSMETYMKGQDAVAKATKEYGADSEEVKEAESNALYAQIGAYADLAGAAAGFFEEGSKGAQVMQTISATLGIVQGVQAIISAWGSAPFPFNLPAVAATTAAVIPLIAQLKSSGGKSGGGGGGGGGGGSREPAGYAALSKAEMIERQYEPLTNRLDKQIELLEAISKNGSAQALNVAKSPIEFEKNMRLMIETSFSKVKDGGSLARTVTTAKAKALESTIGIDIYKGRSLNLTKIRDLDNFLSFAGQATKDLGYFAGVNNTQRQISLDTFITGINEVISDFALSMADSMDEMKDARDTFKELFDGITGTTFYASQDLAEAWIDVNKLIGNSTLPEYLKNQVTAITAVEEAFNDQIGNILNMTNDFATQVSATKMLNQLLGTTFEAGTRDALDYIDSISLVAEGMVEVQDEISSLYDSIKDFIIELRGTLTVSSTVSSFNTFSVSFNEMVDAIATGSKDIEKIGQLAIDNANSYIEAITVTATASKDIQFAKQVIANKFESVTVAKDISLTTVNETIKFSLDENSTIVTEIRSLKDELVYLNSLNLTQTATQVKTLSATRALIV